MYLVIYFSCGTLFYGRSTKKPIEHFSPKRLSTLVFSCFIYFYECKITLQHCVADLVDSPVEHTFINSDFIIFYPYPGTLDVFPDPLLNYSDISIFFSKECVQNQQLSRRLQKWI